MNKYAFTNNHMKLTIPPAKNEKEPREVDFREIYALIDIPQQGVKKGDVGGWLESESNLSQEGNCWVHKDSRVSGRSIVKDNATVSDASTIRGASYVEKNAEVKLGSVVVDSMLLDDVKLYSAAIYESTLSGPVSVTAGFMNNTTVVAEGNPLWGGIFLKECVFKQNLSPILIKNTEEEDFHLEDVTLIFKDDKERHAITGYGYIRNLFGETVTRIALKSNMEIENVLLLGKTSFFTLDGTKKYLVKGESKTKSIIFDSGIFASKNPNITGQVSFKGNIRAHELTATGFSSIQNEGTSGWLDMKNVTITELARLIRSKVEQKGAVVAKELYLVGDSLLYAK